MLHYYFRSKDKLFEAIFNDAFQKFIPRVVEKMNSDASFEEKIETFVENYITTIIEVPQIPIFVLTELHRNPRKNCRYDEKNGSSASTNFCGYAKRYG